MKTDGQLLEDFYFKIVREAGITLPREIINQSFGVLGIDEKKALEDSFSFARFRLAYRWREFKSILWIKFLRTWRPKTNERNINL